MKPKNQRLVLALLALVAIIGAGFLALAGLRDNAALFRTPAELAANPVEPGRDIRLGGMVAANSIREASDGVTIDFIVEEGEARVPVRFTGIAPDLFRESSGVVAEGAFDRRGTFIAHTILAKHDENYMPPQMADMETRDERLQRTLER
ncbi:MAG: cytochrome c maturation protein CcmE [Sphingomonadaceae bacterium]|nr:cytochrome c maturation protein CcmE [Sphingomonadaceae bacterium]